MTDGQNDIEMKDKAPAAASYEETYKKLLAEYMRRLANSVEAIENILSQRQLAPLGKDDLRRAQKLAHGMAGSGTTFGFPSVTDTGRKADSFLDRLVTSMPEDGTLDSESYDEFDALMRDLQGACRRAAESGPPDVKKSPQTIQNAKHDSAKDLLNVLIVDDDENLAQMLALRLVQKGIRVTQARDGKAALHVMEQSLPDLIVLDIMIPGLNGHEVLRRLKQDPFYVNIPVIMLTGRAQQNDVVGALHSGAIDYVIKPFDPDQLVGRIEKILDASRYTVMVADNDPLILQLLESRFRNRGFRVLLASDGQKALDLLRKQSPDLLILDVMMPEINGISLLKKIRGNTATADIPVMMLSGYKDQRDIDKGMDAGAQDYVTKPFIPDDLINRALKVLKDAAAASAAE